MHKDENDHTWIVPLVTEKRTDQSGYKQTVVTVIACPCGKRRVVGE